MARLGFWLCVGLAGLTKGPPAAVLLVYALVGSRALAGSWRAARIFGWWWGLPLSAAMVGWWVLVVWKLNPDHLREVLWKAEIWGRVTGLGPEGNREGPRGWLTDIFNQALFYFARFAPWSLCSVMAAVKLWRRGGWLRTHDASGAWLHGAAVMVVVVIGLFTLSTGKRADYIAAAFPPGALLAAWWIRRFFQQIEWSAIWPTATVAAGTLAGLTIVNQLQFNAPSPIFDRSIMEFVRDAGEVMRRDPRQVLFYWTGTTHMKAYMGYSEPDLILGDRLRELRKAGTPFWIVAGRESEPPLHFDEFALTEAPGLELRVIVRSPLQPQARGWPTQMTLYEALPPGSRSSR